jgi:NADH-quinone oxidoreductase subunit J
VVLLLFGLMLTRAPIGREALDNQQRLFAAITGLFVLVVVGFLLWEAFGDVAIDLEALRELPPDRETGGAIGIGRELFRTFVLPFEVVSFLLLAALVGAIVLARKEEPE